METVTMVTWVRRMKVMMRVMRTMMTLVRIMMMMMSMMKVMMTMMTYIGEDNDNVDCQVPLAMPQRVKREAHDVILDFIRSRPPLKPVRSIIDFF